MKVGIIGAQEGIHETRFIRAFDKRGIEAEFFQFYELSQHPREPVSSKSSAKIDFFFGGPLHLLPSVVPGLEQTPFIAVSYAYDILHEAKLCAGAAARVRKSLELSCGLVVDCEAVANAASEYFDYERPSIIRAWGLEGHNNPSLVSTESSLTADDDSYPVSRIVSVRNFTELHGVIDVVHAFGNAASKDTKIQLVLAGDGPLREKITDAIEDLSLSNRVRLLGSIPESEIVRLIQQAAVYVSASIVDGTSISLLQALNAGVPVLLSNVGGNPEWASRVEGASLFEPSDRLHLAYLMTAATKSDAKRYYDRSEILSQYADWEKNADDIVDFAICAATQTPGRNYSINRTSQ